MTNETTQQLIDAYAGRRALFNELHWHLDVFANAYKNVGGTRTLLDRGYAYPNAIEFILREGKLFVGAPLGRLRSRTPKCCFANAYDLARRSERYAYAEGYAYSGLLAVYHAWNVDLVTGRAVDTTWASLADYAEIAYRGIIIPVDVVKTSARNSGQYGVIDNLPLRWPLLREPFGETLRTWREEGIAIAEAGS